MTEWGLIIVFGFLFGYMGYLSIEQYRIKKYRKTFKHVIHVNGTRGKSTVCRMIDGIARQSSFRVFTKTTGTIPMVIDTKQTQKPIKRLGLANIREQIRIMKEAYQEQADILVIECMAIDPKLQFICQHQILEADITIITNVRHDHLLEMGNSVRAIAQSMATTVPYKGILILGDSTERDVFEQQAKINQTEILGVQENSDRPLIHFEHNKKIAMVVGNVLGIPQESQELGLAHFFEDPGALRRFTYQNTQFINGFSINDPDSTIAIYDELCKLYSPHDMTLLINNRSDRPMRTLQMIQLMQKMTCKKVILAGSNVSYIRRRFKQMSLKIEVFSSLEALLEEQVIFAFGNIANQGLQILHYFESIGVESHV